MSGRMFMGASGVAGGDETAYSFDGTGDYLSIPDSSDWDIGAGNKTISMFVKFNTFAGAGGNSFISQEEDGTYNDFWQIRHVAGSGLSYRSVSGGSLIVSISAAGEITDTDWHHVAMCKVSDEYGIYVDGIQVSYLSDSSTATMSALLTIGTLGEGLTQFFDGYIDEVLVTNTNYFSASPVVGTTDTITVPTERHTSDSNTLLLIHGNESKSPFADDDNSIVYSFDGTNDFLTVPAHSDFNYGTNDFTVEAWIKTTDTGNLYLFYNGMATSTGSGLMGLAINNSTANKLNLRVYPTTSGIDESVTSTTSVNDGVWHHVAMVRDGNTMRLFVDGTEEGTPNVINGSLGDAVAAQQIGTLDSLGFDYTGLIDEFRVSDTARWTSDFTPPTERYTSDSNTLLLIHGDESKTGTTGSGATFTDSGNTGHTVSENGNAIADNPTGNGAIFTDSGNTGHTVSEKGDAKAFEGKFYKF